MSSSPFDDVDDSDLFSPDPPPPPSSHDYDVAHTISMFERSNGSGLVWTLSTALHALEINCFNRTRPPLTADERLRVMAAVERAYRAAWRQLPAEYPRQKIVTGMSAAAMLVNRWHWSRAAKTDDAIQDAKALARCFRNDLHNLSLQDEMRERAESRELFGQEVPSVFPPEPPAIAFIAAA